MMSTPVNVQPLVEQVRQFYLEFPILSTAWRELRWSHYKILMRIKSPVARDWYANEAISQGWSVVKKLRELILELVVRGKLKNLVAGALLR